MGCKSNDNGTECCCLLELGKMYGYLNNLLSMRVIDNSNGLSEEQYIRIYNRIKDSLYFVVLFTEYLIYNKFKIGNTKCYTDKKTITCDNIYLANNFANSFNILTFSYPVASSQNFLLSVNTWTFTVIDDEVTNNFNIENFEKYINTILLNIYNTYWMLVQELPNADKYFMDINKIVSINRDGMRYVSINCFATLDLNSLTLNQINSAVKAMRSPISITGDPLLFQLTSY